MAKLDFSACPKPVRGSLLVKELYRGKMKFEGNRRIVFDVADRLPEEALRHCISLALTYHLRKKQRVSKK
jgi:hypothetical protein